MELDLKALRTFHRMAREGAGVAATRLSNLTGVDTNVDVTKIKFVNAADIRQEFDGDMEHLSVRVDLVGGPGGQAIIVFDRDAAVEVTETVLDFTNPGDLDGTNPEIDDEELDGVSKSALTEISHMMNCGFIDGWADVLDTGIDISPPEFRSGENSEDVFGELSALGSDSNLALMFQSRIEVVGEEFSFYHYLFPDLKSLDRTLSNQRDTIHGFRFEKLIGFDQMVEEGANEASNHMSQLTGVETDVEIRNLNFVPVRNIPSQLSDQNVVGVAFTYEGLPSGYLLFVFDEESAEQIIQELLPTDPDDPFGDLGKSALQELGNIMASGVLDGWANVLSTTIDHSPPEYIHDIGSSIMDPIAAQVGQNQDYAFVFDTVINADDKEFDCSIFSVSEEGDLEQALSQLDMDKLHKARETPDFPVNE